MTIEPKARLADWVFTGLFVLTFALSCSAAVGFYREMTRPIERPVMYGIQPPSFALRKSSCFKCEATGSWTLSVGTTSAGPWIIGNGVTTTGTTATTSAMCITTLTEPDPGGCLATSVARPKKGKK